MYLHTRQDVRDKGEHFAGLRSAEDSALKTIDKQVMDKRGKMILPWEQRRNGKQKLPDANVLSPLTTIHNSLGNKRGGHFRENLDLVWEALACKNVNRKINGDGKGKTYKEPKSMQGNGQNIFIYKSE